MQDTTYPYRTKASSLAFATAFFAVCAFAIAHEAQTNRRGLIIDGIIRLAPDGATLFYGAVAILSALLSVLGLVSRFARLVGGARYLTLTARDIIVPRGLLTRVDVTVPYAAIHDLRIVTVRKQIFLEIRHVGGRVSIVRSAMPSKEAFDQLLQLLAARVRTASA